MYVEYIEFVQQTLSLCFGLKFIFNDFYFLFMLTSQACIRPLTSSLLMGTDGCRRLPISLRYSKRSASSFVLSLSVFSTASSTNRRTFLIWVTVRAWQWKNANKQGNLKQFVGFKFQQPSRKSKTAGGFKCLGSCTESVSAVRDSRFCASSGRESPSPTGSFFCIHKKNRYCGMQKYSL